jgi:DNA processing protein
MPLAPAALRPLLQLATVPGVGPARLAALLRHFGSPERALNAAPAELGGLAGFGAELLGRLHRASGHEGAARAERALERMERAGAVALTPADAAYPEAFGAVAEPPYLIFAAGRLEQLSMPGVAMVGTRSPTGYGRGVASRLSAALAESGFAVVSGMARGIDSVSHAAALDAGGPSIGVLGHGIDEVYPAENRRLFERMREGGLLITEYLPGEQPKAGNFPRRNRLIAALSRGVVVVEMGLKSGAQHTVTYALEQGREVFAVPGPITSPASEGANQLLKDGARVVTSVDDIFEELGGVGESRPRVTLGTPAPAAKAVPAPPGLFAAPADLSDEELKAFHALSTEARHVDALGAASGLSAGDLLGALLGLELRGLAESLPGKHFRYAQGE